MILNLDTNFTPLGTANSLAYEAFTFSGGEPHIKIKAENTAINKVSITHRINSFNDFGLLLVATDALRRMGVKELDLFIPYFPAARQDRLMVAGEPLTVKVYADIINNLGFAKVYVFDPHSDVTPALLNNCTVVYNYHYISEVVKRINSNSLKLISPDGGALKKVYKLAEKLGTIDVVECSKSRDVATGKLTNFKVYDEDLQGADCLIVDDICDGGGTFLGLADALKAKNTGNLYLAVSHGIFCKGFEALKEKFTAIYTTNSFRDITGEGVEQIKIELK